MERDNRIDDRYCKNPIWAEMVTGLFSDRDLEHLARSFGSLVGDDTGGVPDLILYNHEFASRIY